jgi:hypothetical protein
MENGFEGKCANLSGGLVDWEHSGLPIVIDINERLSGPCVCQLRPREKKIKDNMHFLSQAQRLYAEH